MVVQYSFYNSWKITTKRIIGAFFVLCFVFLHLFDDGRRKWNFFGSTLSKIPGKAYSEEPFIERIVHLDLKGAPPRVSHYNTLFPFLRAIGTTGLLIEWEDMFPYEGELRDLRRKETYSKNEVELILKLASKNSLEVIPLIQTFGHLEFLLKKDNFKPLSENATERNTICISNKRSLDIINEMIKQIWQSHPWSRRIHIGADEAYHIAEDDLCRTKLKETYNGDLERMKIAHIARVAAFAKSIGFSSVLAWNDMFQESNVDIMKEYNLGEWIVPVVWGYQVDVTVPGYFPGALFERLRKVFSHLYFATAFKGAHGKSRTSIVINRYLHTHKSYVKLYRENATNLDGRVLGVILTGWSRYAHDLPLCELLSASFPSLVTDMVYLDNVYREDTEINEAVRTILKCPTHLRSPSQDDVTFGENDYIHREESLYTECQFPGVKIYKMIEELRFFEWKAKKLSFGDEKERRLFLNKFRNFKAKLQTALSEVYFPSTVQEFSLQNLDPILRRIEDS